MWPVEYVVVSGKSPAEGLAPFRDLPPYEYLGAVRDSRVVLLPTWVLGCVSHYRIVGYEAMARALHPEAFK
jgi:iron complex transport system substrate-binding protein